MTKETMKRILSSLVMIPLSLFFILKGSTYFVLFLSIFLLISSYEWIKLTKSKVLLFIGIFYLLLTSYSAFLLRGNSQQELIFFLFIILISVSTDIGGYVFGNLFKGPKLTKISPKKTYSGVLGSYICSIIFSYLFLKFFQDELVIKLLIINNFKSFIILSIIILLISTISQIGDLIISYFKRLSNTKDTGTFIPGHGGLLDRTDGIIFVIPIVYIISYLLK